jgi:cellobiose epimerase
MESATRDRYIAKIEAELRQNILPFWIRHAVDHERGGFYGEVSNDLVVNRQVDRGALLTSRILWTYSSALRHYPEQPLREMADRAYADLMDTFWDKENGGFFWSISAAGTPLRTRKQIYGQAFGIYALTEYHRATGSRPALDAAIDVFRLIEKHCREREYGGYLEAFTRAWALEQDVRLSSIDMNEPKSQNTHLHVMEAYTNLLRVWPDASAKRAQAELLEIMLTRILDPKTHHLGLFFDDAWNRKTDRISFGHDIEAAWLLHEAAEVLGNPELLGRVERAAVEIARVTYEQGLDSDGALLYEADTKGLTLTYKEWWPQAEAAVGFLDAYQISGDSKYLQAALRLWDFIETHLVDKKNGEWYRCVSREGQLTDDQPKVSFWKCPYHNGRACMELVDRLKTL